MQWLVYVHNNGSAGASREAGAVLGDAPTAPLGDVPVSYARVWIDRLAGDPAAEIRKVVAELFRDYPPLEGLPATHMTEMASLEINVAPGFEDQEAIASALIRALEAARVDAA